MLAERLAEDASRFASGWNFGPGEMDASPVSWIADELARRDAGLHPPEAHFLKLNASKARGLPGLASSASFEANPGLGRGVVPRFPSGN
jgi:CDP-glucose 4,6-dehydratase